MRKKQLGNEQSVPTDSPKPRKKPRKKSGRKKIKRLFEETRVGFILKYEAPLEFDLLIEASGLKGAPPADLIEAVGYASINEIFKTPEFRRALLLYRKTGLYCGKPKRITPLQEAQRAYKRRQKQTTIEQTNNDLLQSN